MTIIEWVAPVLVLVGASASVIAYLRTNISKSTIELYRQDNDALRTRLRTVEQDNADLNTSKVVMQQRISVLEAWVTQAEQIARLERWARHQSTKEGFDYDRNR